MFAVKKIFPALLLLCLNTSAILATEEGFVSLFDGKSLDGWRKTGGGATYRIEGDAIVGEVGPGANTFLCTKKTYGDFIFKVEMKLDVPGNSGIQFRSHQRHGNGRVFGYQCEIDPSERAWSGGIYDESRRGWLFPLKDHPKAQKAFKLNGWNEYVIQAIGPALKTWINGVPCADLIDTADLEGFIALQVHAGKQGRIRWRNIRIKDLGRRHWKPLTNGKDLAGWEKMGDGSWEVVDGVIHGTSNKNDQVHGHLVTEKEYSDFALRLKFKTTSGDSGCYFRAEKFNGELKGLQANIDPRRDTGGLYEIYGRTWVARPSEKAVRKYFKPGQWNDMSIVAWGRRVVVHINGKKVVELKNDPGRTSGYIALQIHAKQEVEVMFKEIEIVDLAGK